MREISLFRTRDRNVLKIITYFVVFIVMFLLTTLTPKYIDDFSYSFSFATDKRILSVFDIIPSMVVHRNLINGRVIPHFLVQLFLMLPKFIFSFFNALNAVFLLSLLSQYLKSNHRVAHVAPLVFFAFSIWVFSPAFGESFLWLDGAINYSWALSALLLFLSPYCAEYLRIPLKERRSCSVTHALLAFCAGAWSENGSLVFLLLAAIIMLMVLKRERKIKRSLVISLLFGCLGYVFLLTAPATAGRSVELSLSVLASNIRRILFLTEKHLLWLYFITATLLTLNIVFHGSKDRIIFSILLIISGVISQFCFTVALYFVERHFSCAVFLTLFSCIILMDELFCLDKREWNAVLLSCMAVMFVFRFSLGTIDIIAAKHNEMEREKTIHDAIAAGDKVITLTNYYTATNYALPFILDTPENWFNMTVASYYGFDKVYGINPSES